MQETAALAKGFEGSRDNIYQEEGVTRRTTRGDGS